MTSQLLAKANYLHISIPYDKEDELITFNRDYEWDIDEDFIPPLLNKEKQRLEAVIDFKDGRLIDYDLSNGYLRLRAKVCDSGTYTLLGTEKEPLCQICGYVPNRLIPPFELGAGDYIELTINADGTIENWPKNPDLSEFAEKGTQPHPIKTHKWHHAEATLQYIKSLKLNKEDLKWLRKELASMEE